MQPVNQSISLSLKRLRADQGWSLEKTAQETGVSKAMLGQIERGESSPTIATLWKIAAGFDVSLTALLEPAAPNGIDASLCSSPLVRSANQVRHQPAQNSMLVAPLFPYDSQLKFEWLELTFIPGYEQYSSAHIAGVVEHIVVIKGSIELLLDEQWQTFYEGDAIRFNADKPHGYRNTSQADTVVHNLIHYPKK
jgi:transcriptional regulator with XRE-family HTH domain